MPLRFIIISAAFLTGCGLTSGLIKHFQLSSVLAAAAVGVAGSLTPPSKFFDKNQVAAAIYCGAFAGMSSSLLNWPVILADSVFGATFLIVLKEHFHGVGGKLGTISFLSVALTFLFMSLL